MSPTQRALKELRKLGATAAITERWNPFVKCRQDLFGFIDILALLGPNTLGLQVCAGGDHARRRTKIIAEPKARAWLEAGNIIEVWSFAKRGGRGEAKRWACRKEAVTLEDLAEPLPAAVVQESLL